MTIRRKTVDVLPIVERANYALANPELTAENRWGVIGVLEGVLHDSGNYAGFRYLDGHEAVLANTYDETRRAYFVTNKLRGVGK